MGFSFPTVLRIRSISVLLLLLLSIGPPHARAQAVDESLDAIQPVKQKLAGGERHYYRIMLVTEQYARLVVDQRGIDVSVKLYQPDGNQDDQEILTWHARAEPTSVGEIRFLHATSKPRQKT